MGGVLRAGWQGVPTIWVLRATHRVAPTGFNVHGFNAHGARGPVVEAIASVRQDGFDARQFVSAEIEVVQGGDGVGDLFRFAGADQR